MRKIVLPLLVIMLLLGIFFFVKNVNLNRLGTDSYYVHINEEGEKIESKINTGEVVVRYEYTLPAFDEKGHEKTLTFTSQHQLRPDAYLTLFLKKETEVTSYEEVEEKEVPDKALDKMK